MALRCVLFSSDQAAVEPIRQALASLGVEEEHCSEAVVAVDKVCRETFQILIVDWDIQPEAATLLAAARERRVTERPLTLAIVSEDAGAPKALQAGANSILRKPVAAKQVTDSLARARDLLRARESAAQAAAAGAGASSSTVAGLSSSPETTLRAGEFLQSSSPASQIDTESEMQKSLDQAAVENLDPLKNLEPMASAVVPETSAPLPPRPDGPRGLQWYLNQRAAAAAPAGTQPAAQPGPSRPEFLGYEQIHTQAAPPKPDEPKQVPADEPKEEDKKAAAELFAYIAGEGEEAVKSARPRIHLGKGPILFASALAACAVVAAPQAPWHPQVTKLWGRGQQAMHAWLNPQLVTPAQAPVSHENFGRAGDEYKLPVAENIPDATTDPSQIRVTPMVDPTAKKPNADSNPAPADPGSADPAQSPGTGTPAQNSQGAASPDSATPAQVNSTPDATTTGSQPPQASPQVAVQGTGGAPSGAPGNAGRPASAATPVSVAPPDVPPSVPPASQPVAKNPQPRPVAAASGPPIPSSLKSQMASMVPDASGNKAPETALPSIEPVAVPETTERALATNQPAPAYPANAKGQQGTVILQVLIGRDGTVQDAKFLQGSLAFARNAIDGVKQWKFKPYIMNGRPVSVETNLTILFRPGS